MDGVKARMRWATQTITLATTTGPRPVQASTYGAWAVHAPIQPGNALLFHWGVSHVPTGLSVGHGFPKDRAKNLCQQLHRIMGDTPITGQGMPGVGAEMRRQISRAVLLAKGYSEADADAPLPRAGGTT